MKHKRIVQNLLRWYARNARDLPWRRTRDPYAIWVSEIMLQQTRVKTVLPYWTRWMRALPNVVALAKAKPELLHKLWEGLGYYTRVRNLQRAAQCILKEHHSRFPDDFEAVLALPGIGPYTAGAVCSIAFNQAKAILDGNVIRVLTRLYGIAGNPRERNTNSRLWELAQKLVVHAAGTQAPASGSPNKSRITHHRPRACSELNQSLMELGALICTPRTPRCNDCPVRRSCAACQEGRVLELPDLDRRPRTTPRRFAAFVAQKGDRFLVRQRPAGVVNAHLWEFPNVEMPPANGDLGEAASRALGIRPDRFEPLGTVRHSITRYRITLEVYLVVRNPAGRIPPSKGRWLDQVQLRQLAFTSAHRKILQRLTFE
jgi:A/G-specific adenine glycosylase